VHVLGRDTHASVFDLEGQSAFRLFVVVCKHLNLALRSEFHRVLDQVHQDLLKASHVSQECGNLLLQETTVFFLIGEVYTLGFGLRRKDFDYALDDQGNVERL